MFINTITRNFFLLFLFTALQVQAGVFGDIKGHKGEYFDSQQFAKAWGMATTDANDITLPLANGAKLKTLADVEKTNIANTQGAWNFAINGWESKPYNDEIMVYKAPGIIANYGNRFEYVFYLPDIDKRYVDQVQAELKKPIMTLTNEYKDVIVTIPRTESGQMYVHAIHTYTPKTSTGSLNDRITPLLLNSRTLFNEYLKVKEEVKEDALNAVRKSKPANLGKEDFFLLLEDLSPFDIAKWQKPNETAPDGYSSYSYKDKNFRIWNYKESFAVGVVGYPDARLSNEQVESLANEWESWGKKKLSKNARTVEVRRVPNADFNDKHPTSLILTIVYPLDGTLKGAHIEDHFNEFMKENSVTAMKIFNKEESRFLK